MQSESVRLRCDFSASTFWPYTPKNAQLYSCRGTIEYVGEARNITEVVGTHQTDQTNSKVVALTIESDVFQFGLPPRNFGEFFPNLEVLNLNDNEMVEITSDDLIGLPKLRVFSVFMNKITRIESDLLAKHPLIEAFSAAENPIKNVGFSAFDHLRRLTSFHFHSTTCYGSSIDEDRGAAEALIRSIAINCPPTLQMIETPIVAGSEFQRSVSEQILPKFSEIEDERKASENQLRDDIAIEIDGEMQAMSREVIEIRNQMTLEIEELTASQKSAEAEIEFLKHDLEETNRQVIELRDIVNSILVQQP